MTTPVKRAESVDANIHDLAMLISTIAERCWPDLGADESRRIMARALEIRAEASKRRKS